MQLERALIEIERPVFRYMGQIDEICSAIKGKFKDGARATHFAVALTPEKKPRGAHL